MTFRCVSSALALAAVLLVTSVAEAQSLGTFRWQLQPFCNVVTVNVAQQGAVYTLDGYDDQCGAEQRAPLVGLATPNPDGTIGLGLNVVTAPGGRGVQIDARLSLATLGGSWEDSAGNSGTLAFGASTGGNPRPAPPGIPRAISLFTDGGFLAGGTFDVGVLPATGPGTRMMWHPRKSAFRAGTVHGAQWDDASIGQYSVAFGSDSVASGQAAVAMGSSTASGYWSTAMGHDTTASGNMSTALGDGTTASGEESTAMGLGTTASGAGSTAMGWEATASGNFSTAMGFRATATGVSSTATGIQTVAAGLGSTAMGTYAEVAASAPGSFVYGDRSTVGTPSPAVRSISPNQFLVRAAGGAAFWSTSGTTYPTSPGVILYSGDSFWSSLSDVNSKENFKELAGEEVLARIAQMPVREWNYKAQDAAIRHVGPTAQDFHAAFGLGIDPRRIGTVDADGIALAAVKALEVRTRELGGDDSALREQLAALTRENDDLRARLARLERLLEKR